MLSAAGSIAGALMQRRLESATAKANIAVAQASRKTRPALVDAYSQPSMLMAGLQRCCAYCGGTRATGEQCNGCGAR